MLKQIPDTILNVCRNRSGFEAWELGELKEALRLLLQRTDLSTRFCFFIDGLDQYGGEPQDVVDVIQSLTKSAHVCASSRPWHVFKDSFTHPQKTLAVQYFTKDDLASFVHDEETLNGKDEYPTLKTVLDAVPLDLFAYFEAIIKKIKHVHRKQMAQIFLVTVDAVSPLPLYAFAFLEQQSRDVQIRPVTMSQANDICESWKSKIRNRCGDLLITREDHDSSAPLHLHVDFLHRTREVGDSFFDPRITLCEMSLFQMKTLAAENSINDTTSLVDEILYYSYEIERTSESTNYRLIAIMDEMDRVKSLHCNSQKYHSDARHLPKGRRLLGKYTEGGKCNFLALTVQARLVTYVRNALDNNPQAISKDGKPLLDYALAPLEPSRVTPAALRRHTERESASVDIEMLQLLLEKGAKPNDRAVSL
ncbi:hypothetical protein Daus18300_006739 [Diaporthe australafricana]|uniref:DUF7791 domain-containing protein n=1 Tax=Diaporthe australafricana TaxID=127596 RepID=A0ABR3WST0_9PEZI